ncbi:hypothetical protein GCM10010994_45570 [Chelatococcus reniformis]|uniref:Uncharacterized protein n=1 Tax=Chelatococcus reniformis TaxID=1494448 RepID=A0A916UPY8_9HYPH|nr:hypothetical protein GCM10010994_45570 [Chelatococcus reniformis]
MHNLRYEPIRSMPHPRSGPKVRPQAPIYPWPQHSRAAQAPLPGHPIHARYANGCRIVRQDMASADPFRHPLAGEAATGFLASRPQGHLVPDQPPPGASRICPDQMGHPRGPSPTL